MAVIPAQMRQYDPKEVKKFEEAIDEQLNKSVLIKRDIRIEIKGPVNIAVQEELRSIYMEAGWTQVSINPHHDDPYTYSILLHY
ncbi:hypothetical protein PBI_SCTP2_330 [Salicola phage SCTP-2]|nr:hypothetical protein PBI_SCTP2_330 [Salicola phage SCTP-2]